MKYMASPVDHHAHRYLFEYCFDGAHWGIEIAAASPEEARERLKALAWARYKGRVVATLPAAISPLGVAVAWVRNALLRC
jgi:hypothetical protein